jgi:hypothetical protein
MSSSVESTLVARARRKAEATEAEEEEGEDLVVDFAVLLPPDPFSSAAVSPIDLRFLDDDFSLAIVCYSSQKEQDERKAHA